MLLSFTCFFPFVWAKSLFIYERERERERGLSYTWYNFCEEKEVALTLYFLGPLRGDNGHEFKANPSGVLLWG